MSAPGLAAGFADPVHDAQHTFRVALQAFARPTVPQPLSTDALGAPTLPDPAAALLLALSDQTTPVWIDERLDGEGIGAWLAFHTGAPRAVGPAEAAFAVAADSRSLPPFEAFHVGTDLDPHLSTTIIAIAGAGATIDVTADGPGFPAPAAWRAPLTADAIEGWAANTAAFPSGVDLLLVDDRAITGLPRTTRLTRREVR